MRSRLYFIPVIFISLGSLLIGGCSSSSAVVVGETRPAITPEQVVLYLEPPEVYEEIAFIEASSKASMTFSEQAKMDVMIERLKKEAAKLGANGVLLQTTGDQQSGAVSLGTGGGSHSRSSSVGIGIGTSIGMSAKAGKGMAIFVPQPEPVTEPVEEN